MRKLTNKKVKLSVFHGITNIGGLGGFLAKFQREKGLFSTFYTLHDRTLMQNHDYDLKINTYFFFFRPFIILGFFIFCLFKFNLFHFYFGKTFTYFLGLELPILKLFRKKIVMHYCGSEVRLFKDVEKFRNPYWQHFNYMLDNPKYDLFKKIMMWWHNIWVDKFISIRSLYYYVSVIVPKHKLMKDLFYNNPVLIKSFYPSYKTHNIPILVHAPTHSQIKGTEYVDKAIKHLKEKGYLFDYLKLENIPHQDALKIYEEKTDIIIDQLFCGDFGYFAVEGMFYGLPVCCFIANDILEEYPDCPIVNATIDNLADKLAWLIENPGERIRIGKLGRTFVEKYCDHEKINEKIIEMYYQL